MSKTPTVCPECDCEPTRLEKWKYTLFTTVIFLVVINPVTYQLVNKLFRNLVGTICDSAGCPTTTGILVHTVIFTLLVRYTMDLNI